LDVTPDDAGNPPFPYDEIVDPYRDDGTRLEWTVEDWDPLLRFWTLPYDPNLGQWLWTTDPSLPSIQAAREFGAMPDQWQLRATTTTNQVPIGWLEVLDLAWRLRLNAADQAAERMRANGVVRAEIVELQILMQDDRDRYIAEAEVQADGLAGYVFHFMAIDSRRYPWTAELINCALAIGNIAYMYCKDHFKRVRPSYLCPGLVPPFGPPQHPAFPSGHSFLGHLIALFLLEIPEVAERYGIFNGNRRGQAPGQNVLQGRNQVRSPLLWLAQRLAEGRERIGVHYKSDSMGSRHLAAGIWWALLHQGPPAVAGDPDLRIECATLQMVLRRAKAEWA
jgi:membrane-associated phospholipid phosphatase